MANDEPPARQPGYRPPQNRANPAPDETQPTASRLSVDVSPRYIRLQPGEVVTATIKIRNMGPVVDEITLTPRGEAAAWITIAPDTLNIYPSTEAEATIRFAPPRAARPPAGLFAFEIAVNADRQPDSSLVYRGSVELGAYDSLTAAATGTTYLTGRRDAILPIKVRNQGNRPANVQVSAADLPGATVTLSAPAFALEPGGEATVWATVKPRSGFMSGPPRQFPFTVSVSSDYSAPLTIDGRMEQLARFSRKTLVALGVLGAVLLTVGGAFAANAFGLLPTFVAGGPTPSPTQSAFITGSPTLGPSGSSVVQTETPAGKTDKPTGGPTDEPTPTEAPTEPPTPTPDPYLGWAPLGGEFSQGPAVVSSAPGQLQIIAPWSDKTLWTSLGDGTTWTPWQPVAPPTITTDNRPAAVTWNDPANGVTTNIFVVGEDDFLYQQTHNNFGPSAWSSVNAMTVSPGPAGASWGLDRLDVFARSKDTGTLFHAFKDSAAASWSAWEPWGDDKVKFAPAAVAWIDPANNHRIDVFVAHQDGAIYHLSYNAESGISGPGTITPLGGSFSAAPTVALTGPDQFEVFARGTDGVLQQNSINQGSSSGWQPFTNIDAVAPPGAISWGPSRVDLFVVGADQTMHHRWSDGGPWQPAP